MKRHVCLLLACLCVAGGGLAQTNQPEVVKLPGLTVHAAPDARLEIPGKVATTNEILEFVMVEKEGRDYESLLVVECRPSVFQSALLLLGAETNVTKLTMEVAWTRAGQARRAGVESLLFDRKTQRAPGKLNWLFNGSRFMAHPVTGRNLFLADEERAHVALWWQPAIPVNLVGDFGNPYQGDAHGFTANPATVPPKGTPVTVIVRLLPK